MIPPYLLAFSISKIRSQNFTKSCRELAKNSYHTLIE
nr:MAG TPA: Udp N-acetylglucosamine O-acyltransferase 2 [Bacteriophage sp.]